MAAEVREHQSSLKSVPLIKMRVSGAAQRELRPSRVAELLGDFDLDLLGYPVLSSRDGYYWIVDGQHRIETLKAWLGIGKWEKQSVTCRVYVGMTEREEADMFDRLNNTLAIRAFDRFKARVTAGRKVEVAVRQAVLKAGLKVSEDGSEDAVSAVTTMVKVYKRSDAETLCRTLGIVHNSFGRPGLIAPIIDGVSRVCARYNGELDDGSTVEKLRGLRGGFGQLMARAGLLRKQTGLSTAECVAAATVDILNAKRGGRKLPSWWAEE